jgi:hypothetical protein
MADEMSVERSRKAPSSLLRDYRGFRLVIAMAAVALSWGWGLNRAYEPSISAAPTLGERLWQIAPLCFGSAISLICLGWASVLLWEGVVHSRVTVRSNASAEEVRKEESWRRTAELKAIVAVFFAGLAFSGVVGFTSGHIQPLPAREVVLSGSAILWIALIGLLFRGLRSRSPEGSWRKFGVFLLAGPLVALTFGALLSDSASIGQRSTLYPGLCVALASAILFVPLAVVAGLAPISLVHRGRFDWALRLNRLLFWTPASNSSTEGWILVMAGRYGEARSYLRPLAFDGKGHPRLTRQEFYLYALALSIDGEEETAEILFESAIQVPQNGGNFHFGLAECLLMQKKEPARACELIETVLAGFPSKPGSNRLRANRAQLIAFHGWALAANGCREEAELNVKQAFAESHEIGNCGFAGLQLPVGHTWLALGETVKAKAAFRGATELFPNSDIAIRAQRALDKL